MDATNRQRNPSNLAGLAPQNERSQGFRAIGVAASRLAIPIIKKRGGGILVRLKAEWGTIVGPAWADVTWPTSLGRDGALKLRAISGAALEVQHRAPLLIERINGFFGRSVITRLAIVQGPLPLASQPAGSSLRPLMPNETKALDERLSDIADTDLREALAQLGRAVIAQKG
jgi:hypothetical protein